MERLQATFTKKELLSIYFTAGYPALQDTATIIRHLESAGADLIEIGIPFSDPLADGPVIQHSSTVALKNGMTLKLLFEQLKEIRDTVKIPLILMGYFNSILQFGVEEFCSCCREVGIDGVIIPDLPPDEYLLKYKWAFKKYGIANILMATPATSDERLARIDAESDAFVYFVSANSTTGNKNGMEKSITSDFSRIVGLRNPVLIGFGIRNKGPFDEACKHAHGAVIGTAFIQALDTKGSLEEKIRTFMSEFKSVEQAAIETINLNKN